MKYWYGVTNLTSKSYKCGHCGQAVAPATGYTRRSNEDGSGSIREFIYLCHFCLKPTYFDEQGDQVPGALIGDEVSGVTDSKVSALYKEARLAISFGAYTSAALCMRKILMHIAVANDAKPNQAFTAYVDHLVKVGLVPPTAKAWVDLIRTKGNEATHEIVLVNGGDAKHLLDFISMLLKIMYEFPSRIPQMSPPKN